MRGTRRHDHRRRWLRGIIPAYAGNTSAANFEKLTIWDHPRVCGEHRMADLITITQVGSSPRMRGTRGHHAERAQDHGIIPAYAGNTVTALHRDGLMRDHPRVCGEHFVNTTGEVDKTGSSPRMRGTRRKRRPQDHLPGIIPAYAGNTLRDYSNFVVSKFMSFVFHLV